MHIIYVYLCYFRLEIVLTYDTFRISTYNNFGVMIFYHDAFDIKDYEYELNSFFEIK